MDDASEAKPPHPIPQSLRALDTSWQRLMRKRISDQVVSLYHRVEKVHALLNQVHDLCGGIHERLATLRQEYARVLESGPTPVPSPGECQGVDSEAVRDLPLVEGDAAAEAAATSAGETSLARPPAPHELLSGERSTILLPGPLPERLSPLQAAAIVDVVVHDLNELIRRRSR